MSNPSSEIQQILGKALVDKDFRDLLYTDRPAALASYDPNYKPTAEDTALLDQIPQDKIDAVAQTGTPVAAIVVIVVQSAGPIPGSAPPTPPPTP